VLIEAASVDADLGGRVDDMFDLAVQMNAGFYEHGRERGYLRADLDATATSRAVIGMIFGLAMMGLNPALDNEERANTIQAAVRLMFDGIGNHAERRPSRHVEKYRCNGFGRQVQTMPPVTFAGAPIQYGRSWPKFIGPHSYSSVSDVRIADRGQRKPARKPGRLATASTLTSWDGVHAPAVGVPSNNCWTHSSDSAAVDE
jgi:hypothetical protein